MVKITISFVSDEIEIQPRFLEMELNETMENMIENVVGYFSKDFVVYCGNEEIWKPENGLDLAIGIYERFFEYGLIIYDKKCRKYKKLERLNRAYKSSTDKLAHFFVKTPMIHLEVTINGVKIIPLLDTGAQLSIISETIAQRCNLMDLIDERFQVTAAGVGGNSQALGKLLDVDIIICGKALPCVLTVIPDCSIGTDMIIGIDLLKCYNSKIDLKENKITFRCENGEEIEAKLHNQQETVFGISSSS